MQGTVGFQVPNDRTFTALVNRHGDYPAARYLLTWFFRCATQAGIAGADR